MGEAAAGKSGGFSSFARAFDPEYLAARKDITPVMLKAAQGKTVPVMEYLTAPGEHREVEVLEANRDGNTLLLMAVANHHLELTRCLLELKSDPNQRNLFEMDTFDYATMHGVRTPIAKAVLSFCDYVMPEVCQGPHWVRSMAALQALKQEEKGLVLVRSSIIGKVPDLLHTDPKEAEYTSAWIQDLRFMAGAVTKGMLLLCPEVGYLERDANMVGIMDVPPGRRYVFLDEEDEIVKYGIALRNPAIFKDAVSQRMIEACAGGELAPVKGLLRAAASPHIEDIFGESVLMKASQFGYHAVVRCLLIARAKPDTQNKDGFTSLLLASSANHCDVVRTLLRAKADPMAKSRKGFTVMNFVKHQGHKEVLKVYDEERGKAREAAQAKASKAPAFAPPSRSWNPFIR